MSRSRNDSRSSCAPLRTTCFTPTGARSLRKRPIRRPNTRGQPASAAYGAFNGLLQAHIGASTTNNMLRDNIFPLLEVKYRSIQTAVADPIDKGHMTDANPVSWEVKPGIMCPVAGYDFYRQHELVEQPIFARARGMANAAFRWTMSFAIVSASPTRASPSDGIPRSIETVSSPR